MVLRKYVLLSLAVILVVLSGCATQRHQYTGRKNTLVEDIPANVRCTWWRKNADWVRIANMTNEEICKEIDCPEHERIVIQEVIKEIPVEKIVEREVIREVPVERVVEKEVRKPIFVLPGVFFDFDKAELRPAGKKELDKAADILKQAGYPSVLISGHTDSIGTDDYNKRLSERRAISVKEYLVGKGVPREKMKTVGHGESRPVEANQTAAGRQANRRVEIELVEP